MSHLARFRHQQQSVGRRALGLFVAVWLNLALQPCAMAFEIDNDPDCPNCPPAQMQTHDGMHENMDHDMPCVDGVANCTIEEDWNHDRRGGQCKLKDAPTATPIAIAPHELSLPFYQPPDAAFRPRYAAVHAGVPPPLHVLHCVYLK